MIMFHRSFKVVALIAALLAVLVAGPPRSLAQTDAPKPAATGSTGSPEIIRQISYEKVLSLLTGTGITAELIRSDDNITYLVGTFKDTSFIMRLIECESEKAEKCSTLAIFANFIEDKPASETDKAKINTYNEKEVFGRAYFASDGSAIGIDTVISVEGGVTQTHFKAQLINWTEALGKFLAQLARTE